MFLCGAALKLREKHKNHSEPVAKNPEAKPSNDKMVGVNIEGLAISYQRRKSDVFNLQTVHERPNGRSEFSSLCAYATEMFTAASRPSRPGSMSKVTF